MAPSLRERLRAGLGSADEWRRDREADLARGAAELEARGHQLYGQAIRRGEQVVAGTTSELREFAKNVGQRASRAQPAQEHTSTRSQSPRAPAPSTRPTRSWDQQILENARRITAEAPHKAQAALWRAAESEPVRKVAGDTARIAGNVSGVVTGGVHMAHDLYDGAVFGGRLLDVTEPFRKPAGEAAWDQVAGAASMLVDSTKEAINDPRAAAHGVAEKMRQLVRETDPRATPTAPTLSGEVRRNFDIGKHQGEIGTEVLPYLLGAGELKATAEIGALSKAKLVQKYLTQGFSPKDAAYLAEPYVGMGHHSILPRRAELPKWLGSGPIPRSISDSSFNVLKPPGISRGEMYELHYKVDPDFKGTGLRRGSSWSGKRLGLAEYEFPQRIWYGTPNATKRAVAGIGIAGTVPFGDEAQP